MPDPLPTLIYVPILHTQREAGAIISSLKESIPEKEKNDETSVVEQEKSINEMWNGIYEKIQKTNISYRTTRIYQDALPVCGKEKEIIKKLAEKGSHNHQLILELIEKGASLEGTEDPDLLIKEYDCLRQLFDAVASKTKDYKPALKEYSDKSMKFMEQRDQFIATRIKNTLKNGDTPLVFMGVRHQLEKLLQLNFNIAYIIYRLPFKKVEDIYNV